MICCFFNFVEYHHWSYHLQCVHTVYAISDKREILVKEQKALITPRRTTRRSSTGWVIKCSQELELTWYTQQNCTFCVSIELSKVKDNKLRFRQPSRCSPVH